MISKDLCVYGTKIDLPIVYILILVPNLVVNRDQYVKMTANVFRIVNLVQLHMMCACRECYFGTNCQLTTKGFGHSLDTIMGYQIRQHESIARQTRAQRYRIYPSAPTQLGEIFLFLGMFWGKGLGEKIVVGGNF